MIESREHWLQRIREARSTIWHSNDKAEIRPDGLVGSKYVDKATGRILYFRIIHSDWSENPGQSRMVVTLVHNEWNNGDKLKYEEYLEVEMNFQELYKPLNCRVWFE